MILQLEQIELGELVDGNPQFPPPMYGHASCYRIEEKEGIEGQQKQTIEVIYLCGGTTGLC